MKTNLVTDNFPVLEMTCASCAVSVESILKSTPGVIDASVNYANQSAQVSYDKRITSPAKLQSTVQGIGYDLIISTDNQTLLKDEAQEKAYRQIKFRTMGSVLLAFPVVVLGMFFMNWPVTPFASMILSAPVVFYFGKDFFIHAWKQAKNKRANMDTLVALSAGIAFMFSLFNTFFPSFWHARGLHAHVYYEAASVVVTFVTLGKWLEERAKSSTGSALKKLIGLQPKNVHVLEGDVEITMPVIQVKAGQILIVKPGEKIPVDGVIVAGHSFIDESMISGEPVPVEKKSGDKIFAGTLNQKGSFHFEAKKVGRDTLLAQIIAMVQMAQGSKAVVQKTVDKIAGVFVPVVIAVSFITFISWVVAGGENAFTHALLTSITVLVIACPCALGLATPTAIMVGVGKGAENNILIKDAESLELAHKVNAVVLDKTGTITEGKPTVTDLIWNVETDVERLSSIFLSMEMQSEHPLAGAIAVKLKSENVNTITLHSFESITARGVKAKLNEENFFAGNRLLINENNIQLDSHLETNAEALQAEAKTVIYFANAKEVLCIAGIADRVKATSARAIDGLKKMNLEIYMLTGDHYATANAVATQVGIKNFRAEVLPSAKAAFIKELQQQGKIVAMIGDGINDSQALAQADVSIAMGKGSDIALDTSKITLITSDLTYISKALTLSAKTVNGIRQNLFWAFVYNVIAIPVAAGALYPFNGFLLDPMIAGAAMALSSLSVVMNSLRLKLIKL